MVCALQYFTMALTTVCATPCSSNGTWDRSSIPLVDGYPYSLRDAMLVDSCSDGLRTAILHHGFDNGLRDAMLVEWRVGSLIDSAHQRLSLRFTRQDQEEERRAEKLVAEK